MKSRNNSLLKLEKIESDLKIQQTVTFVPETEKDKMNIELRYMKVKLDSYEQRNRNRNLVLHGVPEADRENVNEICANVISNNIYTWA